MKRFSSTHVTFGCFPSCYGISIVQNPSFQVNKDKQEDKEGYPFQNKKLYEVWNIKSSSLFCLIA